MGQTPELIVAALAAAFVSCLFAMMAAPTERILRGWIIAGTMSAILLVVFILAMVWVSPTT